MDGGGRLVGGEDVVAQARQVFENMGAVLAAAGVRLRGRRKGHRLPTRRRRPAAHQPRSPGGLRRVAAGEHPRRGLPAGRRGSEGRGRGGGARPVIDDRWNAFITEVEPTQAGAGPLPGGRSGSRTCSTRPGSGRRTARGFIRTMSRTETRWPSSASSTRERYSSGRRIYPSSPGASSARTSGSGRATTRRSRGRRPGSSSGSAAASRPASASRARHRHRLLDPTPVGRVRDRWSEVGVGADLDGGRVPLVPLLGHGGADGALGGRRGPHVVPADAAGAPAAPRRPDGRSHPAAAGNRRRADDRDERCGGGVGPRSRAPRREGRGGHGPGPRRRTRGHSSSTRPCSPRGDLPGPVARVRDGDAQEARDGAARQLRRRLRCLPGDREGRRYEPDVDLYVSPCVAIELPDEDADELEVRLPLSSFLRWVNLVGWAGLAIGNMQLIAPRDEVVLAAGLAWEVERQSRPGVSRSWSSPRFREERPPVPVPTIGTARSKPTAS